MASPERPQLGKPQPSTEAEIQTRIEEIERRLEIADANENTIEREAQREELLEQLDLLQSDSDNFTSSV